MPVPMEGRRSGPQIGSYSRSFDGIRSYGSAKPGIAFSRFDQAIKYGQFSMFMPPSAMNTILPQQPISAIVGPSPTNQSRPCSDLSTKLNAASAGGGKYAITPGATCRKRLE